MSFSLYVSGYQPRLFFRCLGDDDTSFELLLGMEFDEVRDLSSRQREVAGGSPWQPWTCVGECAYIAFVCSSILCFEIYDVLRCK